LRAKTKTKAMWQIINTEIGKSIHHDYKIYLRNGNLTFEMFWIG